MLHSVVHGPWRSKIPLASKVKRQRKKLRVATTCVFAARCTSNPFLDAAGMRDPHRIRSSGNLEQSPHHVRLPRQ